ncbi:MAG: hypothetical protein JO303_16590, partial [Caulobacteraceae bacterium]|nr:hypothetical protein [Caulobacteraceae bacterium]
FAAFHLAEDDGRSGLLVLASRHMIEFMARPGPAPEGDSLSQLVACALAESRRADAEALLDTRIRYATLTDGGWLTVLSSKPWLEGRPMWGARALSLHSASRAFEATCEGARMTATLLEASAPLEAIGRLLQGETAASGQNRGTAQ